MMVEELLKKVHFAVDSAFRINLANLLSKTSSIIVFWVLIYRNLLDIDPKGLILNRSCLM